MSTPEARATGAENIVWDLGILYAGVDDPQIAKDTQIVHDKVKTFVETYRGKVEIGRASCRERVS